jgi:hypothetical protein
MSGRRTCRDMRGICGGYAGICGDMRGYAGICGTDHLPEIGPAGLPFFWTAPPIHEGRKKGTANGQLAEKGMLILCLIC